MCPANDIPALVTGRDYSRSGCEQPQVDDVARRLYEDAQPSVVKIKAGNSSGTGFFIDDKGTVATDFHVVDGAKEHFAVTPDGKHLSMKLHRIDPLRDLAILVPSVPYTSKPLTLASGYTPAKGESVYALGHPKGDTATFISPGNYVGTANHIDCLRLKGCASGVESKLKSETNPDIIASYQRPLLAMDIHTEHGNSGGPVLNRLGQVIAVTDIGWKNRDFNTPIAEVAALNAAPSQYNFEYQKQPSRLAQGYVDMWKEQPVLALGNTVLAGGTGYGAYKVLSSYNCTATVPIAIGATMFVSDTRNFLNATDRSSRLKYGASAVFDLGLVAGGTALAFCDDSTYGLTSIGVSAAGRLASEFIPHRQVLTKTSNNSDGKATNICFSKYRYTG